MNCKTCSEPLNYRWKLCPACGTAVEQSNTCTNCGDELKSHWVSCPSCGTPTGRSSGVSPGHSQISPQDGGLSGYSQGMNQSVGAGGPSAIPRIELKPSDKMGNYIIAGVLGHGGFGSVYRATEELLEETHALKVLPMISREYVKNIVLEFKSRERIRDFDNIIKAWQPQPAVYQGQDVVLYPMELAEMTFRQWLNANKNKQEIILNEGMELFKQACLGVDAIHDAGLTHLDIKPENILLVKTPGKKDQYTAKVSDFGLSRGIGLENLAALSDNIGTPAYMAPEQILAARWKDVGKEADIYALGMILYEMLDGELPYSGTPKQIKEKKRDQSVVISPPQGPELLGEVAMACLQRDKKQRPENVQELLQLHEEKLSQMEEQAKKRAKASELLDQAEYAFRQNDLQEAFKLLKQATALDPGNNAISRLLKKVGEQIALEEEKRQKAEAERKRIEEAERKRKAEEARKKREETEKLRKAEEERLRREEIERQRKAEEERRHREEEARIKREEAEKCRKAEEERLRREEAERQRKAEEERKRREKAERQRKAEAERKRLEEEAHLNLMMGEMVFVQGGSFMMGATPEQGSEAYDNEKPAHRVSLNSFNIGKYPVTQKQWKAVMGASTGFDVAQSKQLSNPSYFKGDDLPVEQVSWDDAQVFIQKLNQITGKHFRLPTGAEWEYAARGGSAGSPTRYSGSNIIDEVAWYRGNSGNKTHPVGHKKSNELGIYDMSGNVWEWCSDWYDPFNGITLFNPVGSSSISYRVLRGGGWDGVAHICRVSFRFGTLPGNRLYSSGFRLACSP